MKKEYRLLLTVLFCFSFLLFPGKIQAACRCPGANCDEAQNCSAPSWSGCTFAPDARCQNSTTGPTNTPVPSGPPAVCNLNSSFQLPYLGSVCAACILGQRPDLRPFFNSNGHLACTDVQIVHYWCNGGVSQQAMTECNQIKTGPCSTAPNYSCIIPTVPPVPSPTITPPAPVTSAKNPRGCGILWTSGRPSCYCNFGGGQGLCGNLPVDGAGGCREQCEKGTFTGPSGATLCFRQKDGNLCTSNNDGSYRFCYRECDRVKPGYSHTVGCIYPNRTVVGDNNSDNQCRTASSLSSNYSFLGVMDNWIKGLTGQSYVLTFIEKLVRVPGLQMAYCDPAKNCSPDFSLSP